MGLRARLILIVTLGLGVSLAATLGILLRLEEQAQRRETAQRTGALLSALAVPVAVLTTQGRLADVDALMGELGARVDELGLTGVLLVDNSGVLLASTTPDDRYQEDLSKRDAFIARAVGAGRALQDPPPPARPVRVSMPVQTGVRWGTLIGSVDEARLDRVIAERRARLLFSALTVSSFGLLVLLLLLSIEVLSPIRDMARVAGRLAAGDFGARVRSRGAAEVQVLANALNEAARRLGQSHDALEAEVVRRTDELTRANAALHEMNERLEKLALTDPLTGLPNRRYLEQAVAFEVTRQKRSKRPFSLLMIDVDHFKKYNDAHGHPQGDELLKDLAKVLVGALRASDIVARVGGEEFVVLLLDAELPTAKVAAEKLRDAVERATFAHGDSQPNKRVTISIGVASWPKHGDDPDDVLAAADKALYLSKAGGRNRVSSAS